MLPEWKLVRGETLKIRKKKATFAIIFISIFIIIGIVTFSYLRLKSSRESAAVSCIERTLKRAVFLEKTEKSWNLICQKKDKMCHITL